MTTCNGAGWCVKRSATTPGVLACDGAGECVKGYASAPEADRETRQLEALSRGRLLDDISAEAEQ